MAVTFNLPPATDPAYLAFLRQTGVQEQDLGAEAAQRISSLNRALARHLPAYADQKRQAVQGVADSYEERGLFRSGGRLRDQVDAGNAVDRNRLEYIANTQDQSAGVNSDLARSIADLRRRAAEQELATRETIGHQAPPMSGPQPTAATGPSQADIDKWNAAVAANKAAGNARTQAQWNDPRYR
jgi:hypothetical protein